MTDDLASDIARLERRLTEEISRLRSEMLQREGTLLTEVHARSKRRHVLDDFLWLVLGMAHGATIAAILTSR